MHILKTTVQLKVSLLWSLGDVNPFFWEALNDSVPRLLDDSDSVIL